MIKMIIAFIVIAIFGGIAYFIYLDYVKSQTITTNANGSLNIPATGTVYGTATQAAQLFPMSTE
jgi:Tfp pilus assembly protein PilE